MIQKSPMPPPPSKSAERKTTKSKSRKKEYNLMPYKTIGNFPKYRKGRYARITVHYAAKAMLRNESWTKYAWRPIYFNHTKGRYQSDCSSTLEHIVSQVSKPAISELRDALKRPPGKRSYAKNWSDYFNYLADKGRTENWKAIPNIKNVRPGDILAHRYDPKKYTSTGHVMMFSSKPIIEDNKWIMDVFESDSIYTAWILHSAGPGYHRDRAWFKTSKSGKITAIKRGKKSNPWHVDIEYIVGRLMTH